MVGDRLNTDILFGQNGGLTTLLVLTGSFMLPRIRDTLILLVLRLGITHEEELSSSPIVPNYVTQALGDFRIVEKASEVRYQTDVSWTGSIPES